VPALLYSGRERCARVNLRLQRLARSSAILRLPLGTGEAIGKMRFRRRSPPQLHWPDAFQLGTGKAIAYTALSPAQSQAGGGVLLPALLGLGEGAAQYFDLRLQSRSRGVPIGGDRRDCGDLEPLGLDFGKRPGKPSLARILPGRQPPARRPRARFERGSQRRGFILGAGEVFPSARRSRPPSPRPAGGTISDFELGLQNAASRIASSDFSGLQ